MMKASENRKWGKRGASLRLLLAMLMAMGALLPPATPFAPARPALATGMAAITNGQAAVSVLGQPNLSSSSFNRGGTVSFDTLGAPRGVAYDVAGKRLFVADTNNNRVLVHDLNSITDGETAVAVLGQATLTSGSANRGGTVASNTLSAPSGVAYDAAGNRLFVADSSNNRVLVYNVTSIGWGEDAVAVLGQANFTSGSGNRGGSRAANTLNTPTGVAYDAAGKRLFVTDYNNNRALVYDLNTITDGEPAVYVLGQADFTTGSANRGGGSAIINGLYSPNAIAFDPSGNRLFIAERSNHRVTVYDVAAITDGEDAVAVLGQANFTSDTQNRAGSVAANTLYNPAGVAYDAAGGRLFVADYDNNRVLAYDVAAITNGQAAVSVLGQANFTSNSQNRGGSVASNSLKTPDGLAYDSGQSRLIATDYGNNRALLYSVPYDSGTALTSLPNPSSYGQSVTFTATVTSTAGTPAGTVVFKDGSTTLAEVTLSGGVASFSTSALRQGSHSMTAVYVGGSGFATSTSSAVSQTVGDPSSSPPASNYAWTDLGTGPSGGVVRALARGTDGKIYAGGDFSTAGGQTASKVAVWDPSTSTWSNMGGTGYTDSYVFALAVGGDGKVYAAGDFTYIMGTSASGIAYWNPSNNTWNALGAGLTGSSKGLSLAVSGNDIYVGGGFSSAGGVANTNGLAKWTPSGDSGTWSSAGGGVDPTVYALAVDASSGKLYVGGNFTVVNLPSPIRAYHIAVYDPGSSTWSALGTGLGESGGQASVNVLAMGSGGVVYSGGGFISNGLAASPPTGSLTGLGGTAKWDPTSGGAWVALVGSTANGEYYGRVRGSIVGSGGNRFVSALATDASGKLYAAAAAFGGGYMGDDRGVAVWDGSPTGWSDLGSTSDVFWALLVDGSRVYAGGYSGVKVYGPPASTTTALTSAPNPVTLNQSVTFTATVTSTAGTPTGNVTFKDGSTTLGTGSLSSGRATYTTSSLTSGDHSITAEYAGVSGFASSTSSAMVQTVGPLGSSTATTLTSSPNPSTAGQQVTFTATVTSSGGTPTGNVTFKNGATTLGTATLSGGVATYSTSSLAQGTHSITAEYGGASGFSSSTSSGVSHTVAAAGSTAATTTALASSPNPSFLGQTINFTATVTSSGGTPTGSVTFKDGSTTLGIGTLSEGTATLSTLSLTVGAHSITAQYEGASGFSSSTSSALSQTVSKATPTVALTTAPNPAATGAMVTFTATVSSSAGTPTGSVTFKNGTTTLGTGTLSSGKANYGTSSLPTGANSITAEYGGDASFSAATSSILYQAVGITLNGGWSALANGLASGPNRLALDSQGNLIAGGYFDRAANTSGSIAAPRVAKWDGTNWSSMGYPYSGGADGMAISGSGKIYIVGRTSPCVTSWNGSAWRDLGFGANCWVDAVAVDSSENVYVGGYITKAGAATTNNVAKWNGTAWSALGNGVNGRVRTLVTDGQGNLYAGGDFTTAGGQPASRIAKWNGTAWSALGSGVNGYVQAMVADSQGNLYAGGMFTTAGGVTVNKVAKWNGTSWSALGLGLGGMPANLAADSQGSLYVAGDFQTAGGTPAANIAKWDGTQWSALGTGLSGSAVAVAIDSGGSVYAGGSFTWAGGKPAYKTAVYRAAPSSTTSLASSPNPSTYGQAVTLTASISSSSGTPTGIVVFKEGPVNLGTAMLSNGVATFSASSLWPGNHTITAEYAGSSSHVGSVSTAVIQAVQPVAGALAVQSSLRPASGPNPPQMGMNTDYDLVLKASNPGTTALSGVTVADTVGAYFLVKSTSSAAGTISSSGRSVTWNLGSLAAGGTARALVKVTITPGPDLPGQTISVDSSASGSGTGAGGGGTVTASSAAITVGPVANPTGSISGTVRSTAGAALASAAIYIYDQENALAAKTASLADGTYSVSGLKGGSYALKFDLANYLPGEAQTSVAVGLTATVNGELTPRPGGLEGTVTSSSTGAAIVGATVEARDGSGTLLASAASGSTGRYTMGDVLAGVTVGVAAIHPDYASGTASSASRVLPAGGSASADLKLTPRPGSVGGTVVDAATGIALVGAKVTVRDAKGNLVVTAQAGSDGSYSLASLGEGSYTVHFSKDPDYLGSSAPVSVAANSRVAVNGALAARSGSVAGMVTGGGTAAATVPAGVAGATVEIEDSTGRTWTVTANERGEFQFDAVSAGAYTVAATAPYYTAGSGSRATVTVSAGGTTRQSLNLQKNPGSIGGEVTDALTGAALSGSTVKLYDAAGNQSGYTQSDSSGNYSLAGLPAGSYSMLFTKPDYRPGPVSIKIEAGTAATANGILSPLPGSIAGTVKASSSLAGLAGAMVNLIDSAGAVKATVTAGNTGQYVFSEVAPGAYTVAASHPDHLAGSRGTGSVTMTAGANPTQDLFLDPRTSTLSGRATSAATGDPVASANVAVYDAKTNLVEATAADSTGAYTVTNLAPGTYRLKVDAWASGYLPNEAAAEIGAGQDRVLDLALESRSGSIFGTVSDLSTGKPVAAAEVQMAYAGGATRTARTNSAGEYAFSEVTGGSAVTVTALALSPGYRQAASSTYAGAVPAGGSARADLELQPVTGTIRGTFVDTVRGTPISGATVKVFDSQQNLVGTATTDADGNYTVTGLPQGTYSVMLGGGDYRPGSSTVTVTPGATAEVKTALSPLDGSIGGKVRNELTHEPVTGGEVKLVDKDGKVVDTTKTDGEGKFAFPNPTPGPYEVAILLPDFEPCYFPGPLNAGPFLAPLAEPDLMPKPSTVTGRLTSATTGLGLGGVRLQVYDKSGNLVSMVTTDAGGTYTLTAMIQGSYTVAADGSAAGYLVTTGTLEVGPNQSAVQNLALTPRAGSVSGTVVDASTGSPVPGADVTLDQGGGSRLTIRTNSAGEYAFSGVNTGVPITVAVEASPPGHSQSSSSSAGTQVPAGSGTQANLQLQPNSGGLAGVLKDMASGTPLAGATLELVDAKNNTVATGTTASDGSYTLQGVPPGTYTLLTSLPGQRPGSYQVVVEPGTTTQKDVASSPQAGSTGGKVVDAATGNPATGGTVELVGSDGKVKDTARVDGSGNYVFPPGTTSTAGTHNVRAGHPDYNSGSSGEGQVELTTTGTVEKDLAVSPKPGTSKGQVTDATTGTGVPGASVRLYDGDSDLVAEGTADSQGRYDLERVPPGDRPYSQSVSAPGFLPSESLTPVRSNQTVSRKIGLAPAAGSVKGKVTDSITGKAVAGAVVEVRDGNGTLLASSKSSVMGDYLLVGLPAQGTLTVSASAVNYSTIASSRASMPLGASAVAAAASRTRADSTVTVDLQLTPNPATVAGRATDTRTGLPLAGGTVQLYDSNNNLAASTTADASGVYTFTSITVGTYTVRVASSGYLAESQALELGPGQTVSSSVSVPPAARSISGPVKDSSTGQPVTGATVTLTGPGGTSKTTRTDAAGTYAVAELAEGTYRVSASDINYDAHTGSSSNVILLAGQAVSADLTLSPVKGTLKGTVKDSTGQPVAGATVEVKDAGGNTLAILTTGANGSYVLAGLPPGAYTLVVSASGAVTQTMGTTVKAGQTVSKDSPMTPAAQSVSGAITDTFGPIVEAKVEVLDSQGRVIHTAITGAGGRFAVSGVIPGSYTLRISRAGYKTGTAAMVMTAGGAVVENVSLEAKPGSIEIVVVDDATGRAIADAVVAISNSLGALPTLTTDAQGRANKGDLPAGTYAVTVSSPGRADRTTVVTVQPGLTASVQSRQGFRIEVLVLEQESKAAVAGAVALVTAGGPSVASGVTNARGVLLLDITASGTYAVSVGASGYDVVSSSSASGSVSAPSPVLRVTLYLAVKKAPHIVLSMSRFHPRLSPMGVRATGLGDEIYYAIGYANRGTAPAAEVVITNTIPAGTTFAGPESWTRVDDRTYVYSVGNLEVGASGAIQIVVRRDPRASSSISLVNTATVGDDGRNGMDLRPMGAVMDVFRLHALFLPQVYKGWAGGW